MSREYTFAEVINLVHMNARNGIEKACTILEADTKSLTHVDSGALRRSWTHEVKENRNSIEGTVGTNISYAPYENWKHPNISQAVEKNQNKIFQIIAEEMQKV